MFMIIGPRQTSSGQVTLMNDLGSGAWARGPRAWHVCFKWFLEVYEQHRRTEARSLGKKKNQNGVLPKRFLKRTAVAPAGLGWRRERTRSVAAMRHLISAGQGSA